MILSIDTNFKKSPSIFLQKGYIVYETDLLERKRPARLSGQGLSRFCRVGGRRCDLPAGNENAAGAGGHRFWNSADKKGYSGTAIFTRREPLQVRYDFGEDLHRHEGRLITAEYPAFFLVCCYTPNAQDELKRIDYRMQWEDDLREYLLTLDREKPVIYCGDLNVAHEEIDLKNPGPNRGRAGFSDQERAKMTTLLQSGFCDTFRTLYPDTVKYSWWSYRFRAREKNAGWRIDYFLVSARLMDQVADAQILNDVYGSDHCPVALVLKD